MLTAPLGRPRGLPDLPLRNCVLAGGGTRPSAEAPSAVLLMIHGPLLQSLGFLLELFDVGEIALIFGLELVEELCVPRVDPRS